MGTELIRFNMVNIMAADALATQEAKASELIILAM